MTQTNLAKIDHKIILFFKKSYLVVARLSLFVVFFWFGFIKLIGISSAAPMAIALTDKTVGLEYFNVLFISIALLECVIGILFLFPKAVKITIPLLAFHLLIVSAPLVLLPELTWQSYLIPTLEGQYIIKNLVIIAVAFGIAANSEPLSKGK